VQIAANEIFMSNDCAYETSVVLSDGSDECCGNRPKTKQEGESSER
jgi:hypothetical protein